MAKSKKTAEMAKMMGDAHTAVVQPVVKTELKMLPIGSIVTSPLNPRRTFDPVTVAEMADSIANLGILQPMMARPHPKRGDEGIVELMIGERRWRAINALLKDGRKQPGDEWPVLVRPATDTELVEIAVTENIQREDLPPLEEAESYEKLSAQWIKDGVVANQREAAARAAQRFGKSERTVWRRMSLNKLGAKAKKLLEKGDLNLAQAEALAMGDIKAQDTAIAVLKRRESADLTEATATEIREAMLTDAIPVDRAKFDRSLYTGAIITDPESQAEFFADAAQFRQLQAQAVEQEVAERLAALEKAWPWAEYLGANVQHWTYAETKKGDAEAGAIVYLLDGNVTVRACVLKPETVKARREQADRDRQAHEAKEAAKEADAEAKDRDAVLSRFLDFSAQPVVWSIVLADLIENTEGEFLVGADEKPYADIEILFDRVGEMRDQFQIPPRDHLVRRCFECTNARATALARYAAWIITTLEPGFREPVEQIAYAAIAEEQQSEAHSQFVQDVERLAEGDGGKAYVPLGDGTKITVDVAPSTAAKRTKGERAEAERALKSGTETGVTPPGAGEGEDTRIADHPQAQEPAETEPAPVSPAAPLPPINLGAAHALAAGITKPFEPAPGADDGLEDIPAFLRRTRGEAAQPVATHEGADTAGAEIEAA